MSFIGSIEYFTPGADFGEYKERLEHLLTINKVTEDSMKVSYLITLIGPESYTILKSLTAPAKPDSKTFKELIEIFEKYFKPAVNIIAERFQFYKRNQKVYESISDYIVEIKTLSKSCKFDTFLDDALRDKLVCGLYNEGIQQKLLNETALTFDKACEIAKSMEMTQSNMKVLRPERNNSIVRENNRGYPSSSNNLVKVQRGRTKSADRGNTADYRRKDGKGYYYDVICFKCGQRGHIKKFCRNKSWDRYKSRIIKGQVNYADSNEDLNKLSLGYLNNISFCSDMPARVKLLVNNCALDMEIDSGACSSVINHEVMKEKFGWVEIKPIGKSLQVITGEYVDVVGKAVLKVRDLRNSNVHHDLEIVVINSRRQFMPLLGRLWLDTLFPQWRGFFTINLIDSANTVSKLRMNFPKVFSTSLKDPIVGYSVHLKLKPNATPIFCKPYNVPFGIREKVEKEIERLTEEKVLIPVKYSEWASPVVVVPKKNGELRLCINCKVTINKAIESQVYPLPRMDDLFTKFANCKIFCLLDLAGAYQQLAVAEDSRHLLTINTHKGLFQFTRLPFGVSVAPAEFQRVMDEIVKDVENVGCYLDDVLIGGKDNTDCENKLKSVLRKLQEHNIRVNFNKCKFFQDRVEYLGHEVSYEGLRPNEKKVDAIVKAPSPQNLTQLKSFIGLLNFYNRFIPKLADKLRPLYDLLRKNSRFKWGPEQEKAFETAKRLLIENNILEHYDPKKEIIITCDASPYGVGAVLAHIVNGEEKPVLFASCTLSDAEKNYSQTHREGLAVIFAVRKFHKYIYGHKFVIYTDHQPLREIFNEKKGHLSVAAARLQRWAIELSMYNYEIKYKRASQVQQADALSRLPLVGDTEVSNHTINFCSIGTNKFKDINIENVRVETQKDRLLSRVYEGLMSGFPKETDLKFYANKGAAFSCESGCIFYGNRLTIPESLKYNVLQLLHDTHIGIVRMKMLARSYIWWSGIDSDIEDFVNGCKVCAQTGKSKNKIKGSMWKASDHPYERIHVDFFYFQEKCFLLLVDSFSKWIEIGEMKTTKAEPVIEKLRGWFAAFGIPKKLVSDNGPPFNSHKFIEFCNNNNIKIMKSPPYHPESNGIAERAVQTVKQSLKKFLLETKFCKSSSFSHKIDNFLLKYRNTPTTSTGQTPADLIFKFKPQTMLDMLKLVKKRREDEQEPNKSIQNKMIPIIKYSQNNVHYTEGENIFYRNNFKSHVNWIPGTIVKRLSKMLYEVNINGLLRVAHINQLKKGLRKVRFSPFSRLIKTNINSREEISSEEGKEEQNSSDNEVFYTPKKEVEEPGSKNIENEKKNEKRNLVFTSVRRSKRLKSKYKL